MFRFIQLYIADFLNLLFPSICFGCKGVLEDGEKILCTVCRINLPETGQHHEPYDTNHLNKFAGKAPVKFLASFVFFTKGGIVQNLIHTIKYKGQKEAAKEVANWYGELLRLESKQLTDIDVIIGVPLHRSRMAKRGYNQADWIAAGLAEALQKPSRTDILERSQFKESQTHMNRLERWENVKTVFSVSNPNAIKDLNVLLVDDVLTTGATLEACSIELLRSGCKSIRIVTLAVAR